MNWYVRYPQGRLFQTSFEHNGISTKRTYNVIWIRTIRKYRKGNFVILNTYNVCRVCLRCVRGRSYLVCSDDVRIGEAMLKGEVLAVYYKPQQTRTPKNNT